MDYNETLEYVAGARWFGAKPGLGRIKELLNRLGNPHTGLKFIHIAGTNGKGSCAAMTASVLQAAGYRTGLFTSPYLYRFNERMRVNGQEIDDAVLAELASAVMPQAEAMDEHPTEFELILAIAMLYFKRENCDVTVLETGLGGRFDATNVIDAPEASVIMNIGLDHTAVLGDTVEKIAFEKAGIIKPKCPCVLYEQSEGSVTDIIRKKCAETGSELRIADFSQLKSEFDSLEGQSFSYKGLSYALPLLGANQLRNAAVVLELAELLRERGWTLEQSDVEHGLYAVSWPARFELACEEPLFVIDGGHNPQCAQTVKDSLLHYFPDKRRVLLIGVLRDKDYAALTDILDQAADEYIATAPDSPRALSAGELAKHLEKYGKSVSAYENIGEAVNAAKEKAGEDGVACAVGSLYLAGSVRYYLGLY